MKQLKTLWAEFKAFAFKGNMIDLAIAVVIGAAFSGVIDSLVKDIIMPTISYAVTAVKDAKNATVKLAEDTAKATGITAPETQPATQPATQPTTAPSTQPVDAGDELLAAKAAAQSKQWKDMASAFRTALEAHQKSVDEKAKKDKEEAEAKAAAEKPVDLSWKVGRINIGNFIGALINFLIIAFAVFIIMVKLVGGVMKRAGGTPAPQEKTTKECPECLSIIPIKARRCPNCTSPQPVDTTPTV